MQQRSQLVKKKKRSHQVAAVACSAQYIRTLLPQRVRDFCDFNISQQKKDFGDFQPAASRKSNLTAYGDVWGRTT